MASRMQSGDDYRRMTMKRQRRRPRRGLTAPEYKRWRKGRARSELAEHRRQRSALRRILGRYGKPIRL
jgi:hypothetical protein